METPERRQWPFSRVSSFDFEQVNFSWEPYLQNMSNQFIVYKEKNNLNANESAICDQLKLQQTMLFNPLDVSVALIQKPVN